MNDLAVILAALERRGETLATAESCTGGLLAGAITAVPGSSRVFRGGAVAYANDVKQALLGVPEATLAASGAVSEATALAMAQGARHRLGCDWALATTGIAGPGGATPGKPVGLVWIAVAGPAEACAASYRFAGDRAAVRSQAVDAAVALLARCVGVDAGNARS